MAYEKIFRTAGGIYYFRDLSQRFDISDLSAREWIRSNKDHVKTHNGEWELADMCLGSFNPEDNIFSKRSFLKKLFKGKRDIRFAVMMGLRVGELQGFIPGFKEGNLLMRMPRKYIDQLLEVDSERISVRGYTKDWAMTDTKKFEDAKRPNETVWITPLGDINFKVGPIIDEVYKGISTSYKIK